MIDIDELKFNAHGLIPAIVVDRGIRRVLMQAWMNRESLEKTMETGLACFWSRSRQELWTKGETSGNLQHVVSITTDCDRDSLLLVRIAASSIRSGKAKSWAISLWRDFTSFL